jgi:hypothetical protein
MATTTNFGWDTPDDTDLVKDGAAAIRTALNGVDTSFVDLKGGTTGQVLAKASGTDLDFSWVAQDDSNAIQNAIVDAKGDLIGATAADTPARLAVGTNGQVLTADSTAATGLAWATASGAMTLISTTSLSGSSILLDSIPATYKNLQLIIRDFRTSVNNENFHIRFNGATGTSYYNTGTSLTAVNASFDVNRFIASGNSSTVSDSLTCVNIWDYANTATWKISDFLMIMNNGTTTTNLNYQKFSGFYNSTAAISSITITTGSGTFSDGTALLYGVN